jgi:hypothetical protein
MKKGKNRSKKSNAAKGLELCIKVVAVIIREYTEIARNLGYDWKEISAFAEAAARLGQIARDEEHLTELLDALDYEMIQELVPLDKRGTRFLKRVLRGSLPDID